MRPQSRCSIHATSSCARSPPRFQILQDLAAGIEPRRARDPAAGMRAGAAKIQAFDRRPVLSPSEKRPKREELIERMFTMKDVTAGQAVNLFQVERRQNLAMNDQAA